MEKPFQYLLRVRYGECDGQLVVFNARYGDYVDVAGTEYFRALFGGYHKLLEQGLDNQVVKLSTSWTAPAKFDDVLVISVETSHIGTTSFSLRLSFNRHLTNEALAVSDITYVFVDSHTYQKTPIPNEIRTKLQDGAKNIIIDHAGV